MTKQELRQYKRLDIELKRLENKISELEAEIISPKVAKLEHTPKGKSQTDLADKIAKLIDLKELYNKKWDELIDKQREIEKAIASLSDPIERALMGYRYIDGLTWEEVCVKINYSWRQVHRLHSEILKKIA